ncbi:hypothetical protein BDZ90DRAFT_234011 [Jaminaea rosea]|uniref:Uncharacterized protein n=1 Tax=Jaminaea rosea TaxID=1569628 RepID=A0A316UJV5_9BASI|nr:hypothetical protein BDZ90DRAFT_234011 [Jaminaea rosea]PWN25567.1 hypothetical protein BDZ90DRAFT_234011 [Jaminaea rosea]
MSASVSPADNVTHAGSKGKQPVDPLREPRRSIRRRPFESTLASHDPHLPHEKWYKRAEAPRNLAFAAPYPSSGVVLTQPSRWRDWLIPGPIALGRGQFWYLLIGQSLIAAVISGAINFGVACATYNHYDPAVTPIYFWKWFPVPLAGDMGVTIIVQQIFSMIITSTLVHNDLSKGPVAPLRRPWPPLMHLPATPNAQGSWLGVRIKSDVKEGETLYMGKAERSGLVGRYGWWLMRSMFMGSERNDLLAPGITYRQRFERLLWTAFQGFCICLATWWWYWPISIAILAPIYAGRNIAGGFIPALIKLIYGAVLSLLTNPIMALLAMGAESSVRRGYPELEIWRPFGGEEDYDAWLAEQGLTPADVEIGPGGIARRVKVGGEAGGASQTAQFQEVETTTAPSQAQAAPALGVSTASSRTLAASAAPTPGTKTNGAVSPKTIEEGQGAHD